MWPRGSSIPNVDEQLSNQIRRADPLAARIYLTYFRYILEKVFTENGWDEVQRRLQEQWRLNPPRDGREQPSLNATIKHLERTGIVKPQVSKALYALNRAGNTGSHLELFEEWRNRQDERIYGQFQPITRIRNAVTACRILRQVVPDSIESLLRSVAPEVLANVEREAVERASVATAGGEEEELNHTFEPDSTDADGDFGPVPLSSLEWNTGSKDAAAEKVKELSGTTADVIPLFDAVDNLRKVFNARTTVSEDSNPSRSTATRPDESLLTEEACEDAVRALYNAIVQVSQTFN